MRSGLRLYLALACAAAAYAQLVPAVRADLARGDFAGAGKRIEDYRAAQGTTPEMLEAFSWLGRGALAAGKLDEAEKYAAETRRRVLAELQRRPLDLEKRLPIALGASIEVHGHVLAKRNARTEAVAFLQEELNRWGSTSIRTRIQKNIHLLSLEGKPAPALEMNDWIGARPSPVKEWAGRPVLLFLWAHWCGDCKNQMPALVELQKQYGGDGLLIVAPTQRFGYAAGGMETGPAEEKKYIETVWNEHYRGLADAQVPLSEENFKRYGASTTPTLVLIDRTGTVKLYHPGFMALDGLRAHVVKAMRRPAD
jgi:thiol-disulfide isomerase/thioredoxin